MGFAISSDGIVEIEKHINDPIHSDIANENNFSNYISKPIQKLPTVYGSYDIDIINKKNGNDNCYIGRMPSTFGSFNMNEIGKRKINLTPTENTIYEVDEIMGPKINLIYLLDLTYSMKKYKNIINLIKYVNEFIKKDILEFNLVLFYIEISILHKRI